MDPVSNKKASAAWSKLTKEQRAALPPADREAWLAQVRAYQAKGQRKAERQKRNKALRETQGQTPNPEHIAPIVARAMDGIMDQLDRP